MKLTSEAHQKIKYCIFAYITFYLIAIMEKGIMGVCPINLNTLIKGVTMGLAVDLSINKGGLFLNLYSFAKIIGTALFILIISVLIFDSLEKTTGLKLGFFTGF